MPREVHHRAFRDAFRAHGAVRLAPRDARKEHDVVVAVGKGVNRHSVHPVGTLDIGLQSIGVEERFDVDGVALNANRALIVQHDGDGMFGYHHTAPGAAQLA